MKLKKILPAFVIIFIAIIIIFAANTNIDNKEINKETLAEKSLNKDSILKSDSIKRLYLLGHFDPSKDTLFTLVSDLYTNLSGMYIRKDVLNAYKVMYDSAKKDGIKLLIISATRNFNAQKSIWEGKYTGSSLYYGQNLATTYPDKVKRSEYILKYSSMPGTSRHHWGADIDINSTSLSTFETGAGKKVYEWLLENANKYGFCQPYTTKDSLRKTGYEEEKWHWSFYPASSVLLQEYNKLVTYKDINGFKGSETAKEIDVIKNYINAVNQNCK
ncbi:MAG: M15 family metallopeptidase [Bacteroidota bacterium]